MNSRMDKYESDIPELMKRTERNADLYYDEDDINYEKFDVNSNITVLKDNARNIDVNQIRDMLDKKYRDNIPKRKSIEIEPIEEPVYVMEKTREYDLNEILKQAQKEKEVNYELDRFNKTYNGNDLIEEVNKKYEQKNNKAKEEKELLDLINTITILENKNSNKDADLLNLAKDKEEQEEVEDFYTGSLAVSEEDFDDFKEMQEDIKTNNVLIKVLIFIFILIIVGVGIILLNKYLNLGLF